MRTFARIFGRSPFVPLQTHMDKVVECVGEIPGLLEAYHAGDEAKVAEITKRISKLEHQADVIKHEIRDSLPRGLFLPLDRANLLTILTCQDGLANRAENLAVVLTFKQAKAPEGFRAIFDPFAAKCIETVDGARQIIGELDELLETGFGGTEVDKVRAMVDDVARAEYDADVMQQGLVRHLLRHEDVLSYGDFFLWTRVTRQLSGLADRADYLAATVRTAIEVR